MMKSGDWTCPQCNEHNFASRDKCFKCGCFRSKAFKKDNTTANFVKQGDWTCICGELNFASRVSCRKCGKSKINVQPARPGDWNCNCGELNFASRTSCRKCNTPKNGSGSTNSTVTDNELCVICMDRKKDTVITVCGHLGYCQVCALSMDKCPICRQAYNPDTQLLKIYNV